MSDEDFNKVNSDTGKPDILHNDKWFKDLNEKYYTLCDKSDEALALPNDSTNETESKETNIVNVDLLVEDIKAEYQVTESSILKLKEEIENHADEKMAPNVVNQI